MKARPPDKDATHQRSASNPSATGADNPGGQSKSMHDGVEIWCDCCSCEAEPYWVEIAAQIQEEREQYAGPGHKEEPAGSFQTKDD
jgi:hypothetical protein